MQLMRDYLQRVPAPVPIQTENSQARSPEDPDQGLGEAPTNDDEPIFMGYDSDLESLADDESLTGLGITGTEDSVASDDSGHDEDTDPPARRIRR